MRAFESLLLLADLLALVVLVVPLPRSGRWMRQAPPIALVIAVAGMVVEGPRWPMVPAYALTGLFGLVWLRRRLTETGEPAGPERTNRLAAGLGILGLMIAIILPFGLPVFRFPHPSGSYPIGTLTYHWVDSVRSEIFAADPGSRRGLMVQIWYPATGNPSFPRAPYVEDATALAGALAQLKHLPRLLFGQLQYVTTNARSSAPVSDDQPNYPVLLFLEGAIGFRQMNTFQVEDLVSHGYIVAAIDQPYTAASVSFPDGHQATALPLATMMPLIHQSYSPAETAPTLNGRPFEGGIVPYLAQDVTFALDRLTALNQADPSAVLTGRLDFGTSVPSGSRWAALSAAKRAASTHGCEPV